MVAPAGKLRDRDWFIRRLGIIDYHGRKSTLENLWAEQIALIEATVLHKRIFVLKCRQVGLTTIVVAFFFWKLFTARHPRSEISIGHEVGACFRINSMLKTYYRSLPRALQVSLLRDNASEIQFGHNLAAFRQLMAGGRGQAKSYTYTDVHATEMAYYPEGSAAAKGNNVAHDLWASILATVHDPEAHVIVESTANGASGLYYDLYKQACRHDSEWHLLFFPWHEVPRYRRVVLNPEKFEAELTSEEVELRALHGLDLEQLAFRRNKLEDEQYSLLRFRREYPFTTLEPFLASGSGWFNPDALNRHAAGIPPNRNDRSKALVIYDTYDQTLRYSGGMDTSGGTGGDYSVIEIFDERNEQVAVWRSNTTSPKEQADMAGKLSAMYGRCPMLIEMNNHGKSVIHHCENLGVRLWKNQDGKYWFSLGGRAGNSKRELYDWARHVVNKMLVTFHEPITVEELANIVEKSNGAVEAEGSDDHDDHADAAALAFWCNRQYSAHNGKVAPQNRVARLRRRAKHPFQVPR